MLSLRTSVASLSSQNALRNASNALATSQTRLSTGYRVNSAMDDAAGLQLATRLDSQSSGMAVAMRNTQNGISMLQTADGMLDEVSNILTRLGEMAVQAADGSSSQADRDALHAEYVTQSKQIDQIINEGRYAGKYLMRYIVAPSGPDGPGTLGDSAITFQTGASAEETINIDFRPFLGRLNVSLYYAIDDENLFGYPIDGPGTELTSAESANALIGKIAEAQDDVGALRGQLGATSNRLNSVFRNLANVRNNTQAARGRIVDTDFATEAANATQEQMLTQSASAMLKQSNNLAQMVITLVQ